MRCGSFRSFACTICLVLLSLISITWAAAENQSSKERPRRARPARLQPIQLPKPATSSVVTFEKAVAELRDLEPPSAQPLGLEKISQLAWAAQVMMPPAVAGVPAADLPMQAYFVLPEGIFVYEPTGHVLQPVSEGDNRPALAAALLKQAAAPVGGCQIIVAVSPRAFTSRYGPRARIIMGLQAGKVAQTIQLQAVAQGLTFVGVDAIEGGDVRRVARIQRSYDPLYVAIIGYPAGQVPETTPQSAAPTTSQAGRRVLFVVPPMGFQDDELAVTRRALEQAGVQVTIASARMGILTGMMGGTVRADVLLNQANLNDYDGVVFIGGAGALDYASNPIVQNLARQAAARGKVVAAIGTAPSILANAGLLRGVRATAYISEQQRLIQGGATYTGNPVEKEGLIITATGPLAAQLFSRAILEGLGEVSQ